MQPSETQIDARTVYQFEEQLKRGSNWFFVIAVLSVVNSIIYATGGNLNFIFGLGISQLVDGVTSAIANEIQSSASTTVTVVGFIITMGISGVFAAFGIFARRKHQWAFVVGMVLYSLDALIFLWVGDWFSLVIHIFALVGLNGGRKASRSLKQIDQGLVIASSDYVPAQQPVRDENYWRRIRKFALAVSIPFIISLVLLVYLLFVNY